MSLPQHKTAVCSPLTPPLPEPKSGARIVWQRLLGASEGLALAQAARNGLLIVFSADARSAQRLEAQIRFFLSNDATPV